MPTPDRYELRAGSGETWEVWDHFLHRPIAGYPVDDWPEATRMVYHGNADHQQEVREAHEQAIAYHLRLYPPPSTRYQVVSDWYATLVTDELEGRVVAEGFKGDEGKAHASEIADKLNADDTRRADHERRKARYGPCRSWRIHWARWRPVISRCTWPADHVEFTRWHCSEDTTGRIWQVGEHERKEF
jgi:hypothetical protein